jgi:hypothetical protein
MGLFSPGRWRRIPASRSLVRDVLHLDRQVPSFAHDRIFRLEELVQARAQARRKISWTVLFMKAYAQMAAKHPTLRQCYMRMPWPHLYEHPHQVATLAIHRQHQDQDWLLWGQFTRPEQQSLEDLQDQLDRYLDDPVPTIFRRQYRLAHFPTLLRRLAWWTSYHLAGRKRCKRLGTYFLTTISGAGAEIQEPPCIHTSGFTYGPLDGSGACRVTITYDHRLMDGHHVAHMLGELEQRLQNDITAELQQLGTLRIANAAA